MALFRRIAKKISLFKCFDNTSVNFLYGVGKNKETSKYIELSNLVFGHIKV